MLNLTRTAFFLLTLAIFSCKKEDDTGPLTDFFIDSDVVLQYQCKGNDIEFTLDILSDTSNDFDGEWPDKDIYRIYVDYNSNDQIDEGVDVVFSLMNDNDICTVGLISQTSTTPCDFYDDVTGDQFFGVTEHSKDQHVSYRLRVPKSRLSNTTSTKLYLEIFDAMDGWKAIPEDDPLFENSVEISW